MHKALTKTRLRQIARQLASSDGHLGVVYEKYGPPPLWDREPGFATLLHIILEQQVSLASAKACFDKLTARVGHVSPAALLTLDDAELRAVGFSRQKAAYGRHLAEALTNQRIDLERLYHQPD